jgi:hypothetical protein
MQKAGRTAPIPVKTSDINSAIILKHRYCTTCPAFHASIYSYYRRRYPITYEHAQYRSDDIIGRLNLQIRILNKLKRTLETGMQQGFTTHNTKSRVLPACGAPLLVLHQLSSTERYGLAGNATIVLRCSDG